MIKETKTSLLVVYDYFYPGYMAGGPIQSLTNLVTALENIYDISVLTSAFDLQNHISYSGIIQDKWNRITLPGSKLAINIFYAAEKIDIRKYKEFILQLKPAAVYLNGIFSWRFFMLPLIAIRQLKNPPKVIICPRGMLQRGALEVKPLKKKIFISALKISKLAKATWHATNVEEMDDIKKVFGQHQQVFVASNIPKKPLETISLPQKKEPGLKLVYLSLITQKKNLLLLLDIIKQCNGVTLDIFGPVKDNAYWMECKNIIDQMPDKVTYKGDVLPVKVQEVFSGYDASVLLTRGENFGHALYESMSAGRPVITSYFTPWVELAQQKAGWNIDITNTSEGISLFQDLYKMSPDLFNEYCVGAHKLATKYYGKLDSVNEYKKLF